MSFWSENSNGNYVYVIDTDDVMTVFPNQMFGGWTGRYGDTFLKGSFDTPEEAQEAMEKLVFCGRSELGKTKSSSWKPSKKGGYYKQTTQGIATVKQAKTGKWFATLDGSFIEGKWFANEDEAKVEADKFFS